MKRISPKRLLPGEMIAIVAPATCIDRKLLLEGAAKIASWGHPVCFDERVTKQDRFLAGTDKDRAESLLMAAKNPLVRVIWCARGGYGVPRILEHLEKIKFPEVLRRNPKILIGYSDITALQFLLWEKIGLKTIHGPVMATNNFLKMPKSAEKNLRELLSGKIRLGRESYTAKWKTRALAPIKREVTGVLLGGNLTLLTNLAGTPWQPDLRGAILLLEDCGEAPYRIDRMLTHLWNAGMLKSVRAVMVGDMTTDVVLKSGQSKNAWKDVLRDRLVERGIPVVTGLPVGHGERNEPLPLGVRVRITKRGKLELLEQLAD